MSRVKSRVRSRRVVEQRPNVIRVMDAVRECIYVGKNSSSCINACYKEMCVAYVCMCVCRPKHMWMHVYIIIMYMGIDRFKGLAMYELGI